MRKIRSCNFTLIELLAVIAIISILAVLGFGSYSYANRASREAATKAIFAQLETAIKTAKNEIGYYPSTGKDWKEIKIILNNDDKFVITLNGDSPKKSGNPDRVSKIFARVADTQLLLRYTGPDGDLIDPWGGTIYYRSPGRINVGGFDLVSAGADGNFGISNAAKPGDSWEIDKFKTSGELACDDIVNF